MSPAIEGRNRGLDLLRALAIGLVFVYHYRVFVAREPALGWVGQFGWVGVDLFFVLSGYLIGHQLLAGVAQGRRLSVTAFWLRRALRTWPAFWLVLLPYLLWPQALGGSSPPPAWRFLTFTQNIGLQPGTAFSHAWSLCIEEQFYLVLPLIVLAALRLGGGRRRAWAWVGVAAATGIALRAALWLRYGHDELGDIAGYYPWVYYATLTRADEFLPGLALALLRHGHPQVWQRVTAQGGRWLLAGLLACGGVAMALQQGYVINEAYYGFWMTALGYSAVAWAFALLVLAALCPGSLLQRVSVPGAAALARWSYSIYLTHKGVAHLLAPVLHGTGLPPGAVFIAVALASVAVGALLYRAIEKPIMAWRDRAAPSLFASPAAPAVRAVPA